MASNVHTQEGIPPETTGPRGPNLTPAQARVLRRLRDDDESCLYRVGPENVIGYVSNVVAVVGVYAFVDIDCRVTVVAYPTVNSLLVRGLVERVETRDPQERIDINDAGIAALEAGNIG